MVIQHYKDSKISFSEDLKHNNTDKWNKILNYRFIIEIGEDILPISKFIFYIKQDRIFLESFCNLFAVASRIAVDKETKGWFQNLMDTITRYEIPMQNEILHQLEGNLELIGVSAEKTTRDYVSYLERVSNSQDLAIILSTIAPCPWTYYEFSESLIKRESKLRLSSNGYSSILRRNHENR